jgi:hypothetical protein
VFADWTDELERANRRSLETGMPVHVHQHDPSRDTWREHTVYPSRAGVIL